MPADGRNAVERETLMAHKREDIEAICKNGQNHKISHES